MNNIKLNEHVEKFKKELSKIIKPESIDPWMKKKNKSFNNRTPIQVIKDGEVQLLYEMIYYLSDSCS